MNFCTKLSLGMETRKDETWRSSSIDDPLKGNYVAYTIISKSDTYDRNQSMPFETILKDHCFRQRGAGIIYLGNRMQLHPSIL